MIGLIFTTMEILGLLSWPEKELKVLLQPINNDGILQQYANFQLDLVFILIHPNSQTIVFEAAPANTRHGNSGSRCCNSSSGSSGVIVVVVSVGDDDVMTL